MSCSFRKPLSVLPLLGLAACVAPPIPLSAAGAEVRARQADPPPEYVEVGPIVGGHGTECAPFGIFGYSGRYESAYYDLRNKTAEMGGHYVRIAHFGTSGAVPWPCYQRACTIDTDERIAIHRLRKRWGTEAGEGASRCLIEVYRAARDPAVAATLAPRCAGEGKTESALRDAVRKAAGSAAPASPKP